MECFYQVLRETEILETEGISLDLSLHHDGVTHVVPGEAIPLHIDERPSGLKIYIPRKKDDRDYAFSSVLPRRLFEHMMIDPATNIAEKSTKDGISAIKDVLLAPRSRMTIALDDNGIAPVTVENVDPEPETEMPNSEGEGEYEVVDVGDDEEGTDDSLSAAVSSLTVTSVPLGQQRRVNQAPVTSFRDAADISPSSSRGSSPTALPRASLQRYTELLGTVISAARSSTFPRNDPSEIRSARILHGSSHVVDHGLFNLNQLERDFRIGAAGELYVSAWLINYRPSPAPPLPIWRLWFMGSWLTKAIRVRSLNSCLIRSRVVSCRAFRGIIGKVICVDTSSGTPSTRTWGRGAGGRRRTSCTMTYKAN